MNYRQIKTLYEFITIKTMIKVRRIFFEKDKTYHYTGAAYYPVSQCGND